MGIIDRVKNAWNAFSDTDEQKIMGNTPSQSSGFGYSSSYPQYKEYRYTRGSIIDTIINKIAIDVSMVEFKHVKMDNDPENEIEINDGLHNCLTLEANIDQSAIEFKQDIVFSMFDEGVVAIVPIDTDTDPYDGSYDIYTMRTGKVIQWYPYHVRVMIYDERTAQYRELLVEKSKAAIITNPLYEVVNGDNSTLKRLIRKIQLLDKMDEKVGSNKLNMLIKMPHPVKSEIQIERAQARINDIQTQLTSNPLGIAYIDASEDVVNLSKPLENNLLNEIKDLREELFNQLGLTNKVFDGTASEQELRSYYDRTVTPIVERIALEFERKFLTKTARTQGHKIAYYSDPFKGVPVSQLASLADTLRRNEILTTNEIRKNIGFHPVDDDRANMLFNPNIADSNQMANLGIDPTNGEFVGGAQQDVDFESLIGNLSDDQVVALLDKARELVGDDEIPDEELFNNLDEGMIQQLVEFINNELIGQKGE